MNPSLKLKPEHTLQQFPWITGPLPINFRLTGVTAMRADSMHGQTQMIVLPKWIYLHLFLVRLFCGLGGNGPAWTFHIFLEVHYVSYSMCSTISWDGWMNFWLVSTCVFSLRGTLYYDTGEFCFLIEKFVLFVWPS